jgi:hypothetical protein
MSRALRPLACVIAALAALAAVAAVVFNLIAADRSSLGVPAVVPFLAAILAPAAVGLFVALRQPANRIAWILLLGPLSVAVVMAADGLATVALHDDRDSVTGA